MLRTILQTARYLKHSLGLPSEGRRVVARDFMLRLENDPGVDEAITLAADWLCNAQDHTSSGDRGVSRHYSLRNGWGSSYPETTGYIVPTMLDYADYSGQEEYRTRAREMLDWLVSVQYSDGAFFGGTVTCQPKRPVTFNTGQILIGLAAGVKVFGDVYRKPMYAAADWLVASQDEDGCWRKNPTPFAAPGEKAYETHVAWGLFEAARLEPGKGYEVAATANVDWALSCQNSNGWFSNCCLAEDSQPLTHTIGYVLRGVLEAYRFTGEKRFLRAAEKTAQALLSVIDAKGFIPGRLDSNWNADVSWCCLTGNLQIAICWMMMHEYTFERRYFDAAVAANRFVRKTIRADGPRGIRGGVKGAHPVYGGYGEFEYLSWAAKFLIDSLLLEQKLRGRATGTLSEQYEASPVSKVSSSNRY